MAVARAQGVELIGEYEDSGFKEPPYLARRSDGQVVQMSKLLFAVAEAVNGSAGFAEIAERASKSLGKQLSAEQAQYLVDKKLRPLGLLANPDGSTPRLKRMDPMLALNFRAALVPEGVVRAITVIFRPLFWPPVVVAVLAGLVALDAYVFALHGVAQATRQILYQPMLMLLLLGLIILSAAFHECGHATACAYGGAKPGVLGAGIYMVWPAFYSDVTDAYRLGKGGRLRTDLGGVYFNTIFMLVTAAVYFWTRYEPLLVVIALQNIEIVHQFLPFLRLDGYYVVADLTGVPDIFGRVKPVLHSLVPGEEPEKAVTELKGWVRVAVTIWVLITVPLVLFIYAVLILNAPRIFATAWRSLNLQFHNAAQAAGQHSWLLVVLFALQAVLLLLPVIGLVYTFLMSGRKVAGVVGEKTEGRPALRAGAATLAGLLAVIVVWAWLPHGRNYTPITPTERGTVLTAYTQLLSAPAALTGVGAMPQAAASPDTTNTTTTTTTTTTNQTNTGTNVQPSASPSAGTVTNSSPQPTVAPSQSP
ncbi:MAG: hypothetical protein E6I08_04655 [Chloroflexi bacterium]|nr:MAG: hypothetical protein E6I08_04655 [Chloroflexota bacterium]